MCLDKPGLLWDVGFQLSCAATLGLILYAGPLQDAATRWLERRLSPETAKRAAGPLGEYVLFTLAAQATTLPVIAFHFHRVSLSALLANPLILPAQPLVMVLGGVAVIGGLIWLPLGQVLGWAAWPFLVYSVRIAEIFGGLPGSELISTPSTRCSGAVLHPAVGAHLCPRLAGASEGAHPTGRGDRGGGRPGAVRLAGSACRNGWTPAPLPVQYGGADSAPGARAAGAQPAGGRSSQRKSAERRVRAQAAARRALSGWLVVSRAGYQPGSTGRPVPAVPAARRVPLRDATRYCHSKGSGNPACWISPTNGYLPGKP